MSRWTASRAAAYTDRLRARWLVVPAHAAIGGGLTPGERRPGWYALSEGALASDPAARAGAYDWLKDYACTRVGRAIRLDRVPR